MDYLRQIQTLTEEYIAAPEKDRIQGLSIDLPSFDGNFWIIEVRRLAGYTPHNDIFELAIVLAYSKGKINAGAWEQNINDSGVLSRFINLSTEKKGMYIKKTDNSIPLIISTVQAIVEQIVPTDSINDIKATLPRFGNTIGTQK